MAKVNSIIIQSFEFVKQTVNHQKKNFNEIFYPIKQQPHRNFCQSSPSPFPLQEKFQNLLNRKRHSSIWHAHTHKPLVKNEKLGENNEVICLHYLDLDLDLD